jgi:hypothetical protein
MAFSSNVSFGDIILASQYNNLRKDVIDLAGGHAHDETDSRKLATLNIATGHNHDGINSKKTNGWNVIYSSASLPSAYTYTIPAGTKQLKFRFIGVCTFFDISDVAYAASVRKLEVLHSGTNQCSAQLVLRYGLGKTQTMTTFDADFNQGYGTAIWNDETNGTSIVDYYLDLDNVAKLTFDAGTKNLIIEELTEFIN